jgi:hypothetical protein
MKDSQPYVSNGDFFKEQNVSFFAALDHITKLSQLRSHLCICASMESATAPAASPI